MSIEIARYQFHSWARKGLASTISEPDDLGSGNATAKQRTLVNVPVSLNDEERQKNFNLVGPGDIIGVNPDMIIRTQPVNNSTGFERNYLAFVEFYDEDFLWRYTPAAAVETASGPTIPPGNKLRPWLFLLILKDDEFKPTKRKSPLPSIVVSGSNVFPPATETWLWAHVHSDANLPDNETNTLEDFLISLNNNATLDPDQLYCRLLSPRSLEVDTAYHGFVIPAFETGRRAGLGESEDTIQDIVAQQASWSDNGANGEMPVYFEWFFKTGANEDFESLVKKLEPVEMDARVGIRDMDCANPGFVKADGTVPFPPTQPPVLGLEGALKSPRVVSTQFPATDDQFQQELEKVVNLQFSVTGTDSATGDPIISLPLYGGKHARKNIEQDVALDIKKDTWLHELNRDPRTRVAAGFGTTAVQTNQEVYMRKAWSQVQDIIDANKQINKTLFHMNIAIRLMQKTFNRVPSNALIGMCQPVLSRIMGTGATLQHQISESDVPLAVFSATFRKMAAPNRRFQKMYSPEKKIVYDKVVAALGEKKLSADIPKQTPGGTFSLKDAAEKIRSNGDTGSQPADELTAQALLDPNKQLESLASIPQKPAFSLKLNADIDVLPPTTNGADTDSVEAKNYRQALLEATSRIALTEPEKAVLPLSLSVAQTNLKEGINPRKTFPKRLNSLLLFPNDVKIDQPEKIFAAMAYPDLEDPMYKKLLDISAEAFLPNLQYIKNNSISLLVTNPRVIESYMVGLNHEMARELLWKEYPTDQRGSYFRQFWDVSGLVSPSSPGGDLTAADKAAFKDITPIQTWNEQTEKLGTHNNRITETANQEQLVLAIRGDLFHKYPNTIVFAQKAVPAGAGDVDYDDGRKIERDLTDEQFKLKVKFPLYKAEIQPDIKFFGFDLTADRAKGTTPGLDPDNLGWYFVIMQAPGAPVFGMDVSFNEGSDGLSWDDLSWKNLPDDLQFITRGVAPSFVPSEVINWAETSASMAYILLQKPNMIAVHANKMLKGL